MEETTAELTATLTEGSVFQWLADTTEFLLRPWSLYQLLIIIAAFGLAHLLGNPLEKRLEAWARGLKTSPHILRLIVAVMRRTRLIIFIILLGITFVVLQDITWSSRSYIIGVVLRLAIAWLVISVASRIIRSRFLARIFALVVWTYFAASVLGVTDDLSATLDAAAFQVGEIRLSALTVLKAAIFTTIAIWLATTLGNFLDDRVQRVEDMTPSFRVLIGKVVKIGLLAIALLMSLSAVGIDLTAFAVFSGAIGVGLGFGLQKVVSNFISGIIILLDKSIKPGDTITLGDTFGWIRELRARFVSVVTRDGREFLIPNEDFITQQVINWSFTDELVRLDVHFGVSYSSNPHQVIELSKEAATKVERVLQTNKPVCWMTGFGGSSIDFILRFWISDPQNGLTNIRGQVLVALWDIFKENGVEFPFPHREIIMRTPVEIVDGRSEEPAQ
ncbi:MAG: mechanosensitive ion channel domain-containing protein [Pseudomonadota bacterium]